MQDVVGQVGGIIFSSGFLSVLFYSKFGYLLNTAHLPGFIWNIWGSVSLLKNIFFKVNTFISIFVCTLASIC